MRPNPSPSGQVVLSSFQRLGKQTRKSGEGPSNQRAVKQLRTAGSSNKCAYVGRGDGSGTGPSSGEKVSRREANKIVEYCPAMDDGRLIFRTFVCGDSSALADGVVLKDGKLYSSRSKDGPYNTFFFRPPLHVATSFLD